MIDIVTAYVAGERNFSRANLIGANLSRANLSGADLSGADLSRANLYGANLSGADLSGAKLPAFQICPQQDKFTAWKKLARGVIAKVGIPRTARRTSSLVGRKCRASRVKVLWLSDGAVEGVSEHDSETVYRVGGIVTADSFDPDIRVECTHGIHFFMTREEAEAY